MDAFAGKNVNKSFMITSVSDLSFVLSACAVTRKLKASPHMIKVKPRSHFRSIFMRWELCAQGAPLIAICNIVNKYRALCNFLW